MEEEAKHPHELTIEESFDAIASKLATSSFLMIAHKYEPLAERTGLLGDHARLKATVLLDPDLAEDERDIKREVAFFVKFFPRHPAPARFASETGAFAKELFAYNLLEEFAKHSPRLVGACTARRHAARADAYLVLDDLSEEGYRVLGARDVLDYDGALAAITALARLHASSIIYEEGMSRRLQRIFRLGAEFGADLEETFYNAREGFVNKDGVEASIRCVLEEIDVFGGKPKLASGRGFKEAAGELCARVYDLAKPSTTHRNVLCHGDCWSSNLLLGDDPARGCKLVDFQCARYAPPSHDVMSLLHLATTRGFRGQHLYTLLGVYYAVLEKTLKVAGVAVGRVVPFADFMRSCEEQKVFALVQTATYLPLILVKREAVEEYFSGKGLDEVAVHGDRTELVLENVARDAEYRARLEESIRDLRDYCEFL